MAFRKLHLDDILKYGNISNTITNNDMKHEFVYIEREIYQYTIVLIGVVRGCYQ